MKIIDYDKKGNVIRFYLGENKGEWGEDDYWGDDWDDRGCTDRVYKEFIKGWIDVAFTYDYYVLDAINDWTWNNDSPFSKKDLKNRKSPCIIVYQAEPDEYVSGEFAQHALDANAIKFYFNDPVEKVEQCKNLTVLERWDR